MHSCLLQTESPLLSHGMSSVSVCHLKIGEPGNHGSLRCYLIHHFTIILLLIHSHPTFKYTTRGKLNTNNGVLCKYLILSSKDNANYSFGLTVSPSIQQLIYTLAASDPFFCSLSIQKLSLNPHGECLALPLQNYTHNLLELS